MNKRKIIKREKESMKSIAKIITSMKKKKVMIHVVLLVANKKINLFKIIEMTMNNLFIIVPCLKAANIEMKMKLKNQIYIRSIYNKKVKSPIKVI